MTDWFRIPHLIGVRVTGADALVFCQSQFTADLRQLPQHRWQITAWCDPKGRCLSVLLVASDEAGLSLILPADQADLRARLSMYAIGRKLDLSEPVPISGCLEPEPDDCLVQQAPARALRLGNAEEPDEQLLRSWRIADLCLPLPWLDPSTSGRFLPQFLGLEHNGGLSYTKGCFPGQEVIARLHYLGKVKHHLLGFELSLPADPTAVLRLTDPDRTENAGEVLARLVIGDQLIGLAVCPVSILPGQPVRPEAGDASGQVTEIRRLCYYLGNNTG